MVEVETHSHMGTDDYLDDLHIRILRVTEDLRAIQRELNCAAMEAPGDPELMEALAQLPEMESIQVLRSALDQMRHFLWFYMQVMANDSDSADEFRQMLRRKSIPEEAISTDASLLEKLRMSESTLLRYLCDVKNRKPN
ncbi:MAG TPA: hypothetical protein VFB28_00190 [Terriglobales bacterium]|nr:hypothetical protein [Terriglobales bacterium]